MGSRDVVCPLAGCQPTVMMLNEGDRSVEGRGEGLSPVGRRGEERKKEEEDYR